MQYTIVRVISFYQSIRSADPIRFARALAKTNITCTWTTAITTKHKIDGKKGKIKTWRSCRCNGIEACDGFSVHVPDQLHSTWNEFNVGKMIAMNYIFNFVTYNSTMLKFTFIIACHLLVKSPIRPPPPSHPVDREAYIFAPSGKFKPISMIHINSYVGHYEYSGLRWIWNMHKHKSRHFECICFPFLSYYIDCTNIFFRCQFKSNSPFLVTTNDSWFSLFFLPFYDLAARFIASVSVFSRYFKLSEILSFRPSRAPSFLLHHFNCWPIASFAYPLFASDFSSFIFPHRFITTSSIRRVTRAKNSSK